VLHPMEPGSTAGDLIVRYLGTQSELRQRIGAQAPVPKGSHNTGLFSYSGFTNVGGSWRFET